MKNLPRQSFDRPIYYARLVHIVALPLSPSSVEKTHLAVRIPAGVENPAAEVMRSPRKLVASRAGLGFLPAQDCGACVRIQLFVGIKAQNPVMARLLAGKVLL